MNIELTMLFKKKAQQLAKKIPHLNTVLKKQFNQFKLNPFHPSLRLHKIKGTRSEQYAIWIKGNLRALSIKSKNQKDTFIFFDIVSHDKY